ncbi:MAG: 50S ribosomal protein L11 methyltransferase [Pseudomonadota bacterium]|nr:50S ribosomal protein L11 methyltransferase [Pseudomonadota bacterium]
MPLTTLPPGPPRLRELTVDAPADREAGVVAAVYRLGVQGVEVRDADTPVDRGGAPRGRVLVVAWLPPSPTASRAIRGLRRRLGPAARCTWRDIPVTWEAEPPATPVGAGFVVVAPGGVAPPGRDALVLDAHLAFGDGLHPTTTLCVEALERRDLTARTVLDVGTGTGILALVAARLGASRVVAQDIDPLSLWAARRHVTDNGADAIVEVVDTLPDARFDLVVANLYFAPLLALLPALAARISGPGELLISGFGVDARARVEAACVAAGLVVHERQDRDGWGMLAASPDPRSR